MRREVCAHLASPATVREVAVLRLPQDQGLGCRGGVAVLEAETGEFGERTVVQLERRPRSGEMLDRGVASPVPRVDQDQMPLAERAALGILPREPDGRRLHHEGRERQRLGVRPVDLAAGERGTPPLELLLELGNDREPLGHDEQLLVQRGEQRRRHRGVGLDDGCLRPRDALWLLAPPDLAEIRLERLLDVGEPLVGLLRLRRRGGRRDDPLAGQLLGVALPHRGGLPDPLVHERLRVGRFVPLVVPPAPVAHDIDHHIAVESVAVHYGEPGGGETRFRVVGIHMDDRRVEPLGEVARVVRRAALARLGREPQLVVGDEVNRAARAVALEPR